MSYPIVPLGDRCLVEVMPEEKKTKAGIIIPDQVVDKNEAAKAEAILIASGSVAPTMVDGWPPEGSTVLLSKYAGLRYQPDPEGPHYRIVNWEDIVAWMPKGESQ